MPTTSGRFSLPRAERDRADAGRTGIARRIAGRVVQLVEIAFRIFAGSPLSPPAHFLIASPFQYQVAKPITQEHYERYEAFARGVSLIL